MSKTIALQIAFALMLGLNSLSLSAQGTLSDPHNSENGIRFSQGGWKAILAKAKQEKKLVFVDAYAVWCGPCRMMANNTFTQKEVGDYFNSNFVNYKFDMEQGEGPSFASTYGVRAYPSLFFIDGEGKVVHQDLGYKTPEQLITTGKAAQSKR